MSIAWPPVTSTSRGPRAFVRYTVCALEEYDGSLSLTRDPLPAEHPPAVLTHAERVLDRPRPLWDNPSLHHTG